MPSAVASRRAVRRLALARLVSVAGTAAAEVALAAVLYQRTGSAAWVAAALFVAFATPALASPLAGHLADRFDRRRVLVASDVLGAACLAAMAFVRAPGGLVALAFGAAAAASPFLPASAAALPSLAPDGDLPWANARLAVARSAGFMGGPLLGGVLVATTGAGVAFGFDALTFLASAALIATLRADLRPAGGSPHGEGSGVWAGLRVLAGDPALRAMALGFVLVDMGNGLVMPAEVALAHVLGAGSAGYGAMVAVWAAGGLAGPMAAARLIAVHREAGVILGGAVALGGAFALAAVAPWLTVALAAFAAGGASMGLVGVGEDTLLQRRAPDAVRGRVYAARLAAVQLSIALPLLVSGFAVDALGPRAVYGIAAGLCAAGCAVLVRMRRVER